MSLSITRRHAATTLAALSLARPATAQPAAAQPAAAEPLAETWDERIDLAAAFSAVGTQGVFVVYDAPTRR